MTNGSEPVSFCMECGNEWATISSETVAATEFGWPSGTLSGIEVFRCSNCGEVEMSIPAHGAVARAYRRRMCQLERRLTGDEYAFLRRALGTNGQQYAEQLGISNVTVSRAEHNDAIPALHDAVIRALTVLDIETRGQAIALLSERAHGEINIDVASIAWQTPTNLTNGWQTLDIAPLVRSADVIPIRRRALPRIEASFETTEVEVFDEGLVACR